MRNGFLGSITLLLAGVSWAAAQTAAEPAGETPALIQTAGQAPGAPIPVGGPGERWTPYWPTPANVMASPFVPGGPNGKGGCAACNGAPGCKDCNGPKDDHYECFWFDAEYLVWWVPDGPVTGPLLTTGTGGSLGVLGTPGTSTVGTTDFDYKAFSGFRGTFGFWLDKCTQSLGLETSAFILERRPAGFTANSSFTGAPVLARPFINPILGAEDSLLVSAPGLFVGSVGFGSSSRLYGWEANFLIPSLYADPNSGFRVDLLAGARGLYLDEDFHALQNSTLLPGGTAGFAGQILTRPATLTILDHFRTRNEFYGGQLGLRGEYRFGSLYLKGTAKVAFGNSHEVVSIDGATRVAVVDPPAGGTVPPAAVVVPGGLLATSSNMGRTARDEFAIVPEFGINVGYVLKPWCSLFVGYNFLYWSDVARPGEQVSRTINPTAVPASQAYGIPAGPAAPLPTMSRTDFWAQGVNFGLEYRY